MANDAADDHKNVGGDEGALHFSDDEWAVFDAFLKAEREQPSFLDGVEYWLWDGDDLRPATVEESDHLRERDLAYFAQLRFGQWRHERERKRRRFTSRFTRLYHRVWRWFVGDGEHDAKRKHGRQTKSIKRTAMKADVRQ